MNLLTHGSVITRTLVASPARRPGVTTDNTLIHIAGIMGYIAFFAMAGTAIWGVILVSRVLDHYVRRQTLYGGHVLLAVTALGASILHASLHIFRHDVYFDLEKVWIPWLGGADTVVSIGIVGLEIVLVVAFSIWLQRRLSYRRWHRLHWWAYPGFGLVALHSALASKEQHFGIIWAVFAVMMLAFVTLAVNRMLSPSVLADNSEDWFDVVEDQRDRNLLR
jgi:DMSO/TMAO reductase YedYZ heme-binding membrane subunit